jgi:hypothetical protein
MRGIYKLLGSRTVDGMQPFDLREVLATLFQRKILPYTSSLWR